jgi:hypothetical protein
VGGADQSVGGALRLATLCRRNGKGAVSGPGLHGQQGRKMHGCPIVDRCQEGDRFGVTVSAGALSERPAADHVVCGDPGVDTQGDVDVGDFLVLIPQFADRPCCVPERWGLRRRPALSLALHGAVLALSLTINRPRPCPRYAGSWSVLRTGDPLGARRTERGPRSQGRHRVRRRRSRVSGHRSRSTSGHPRRD